MKMNQMRKESLAVRGVRKAGPVQAVGVAPKQRDVAPEKATPSRCEPAHLRSNDRAASLQSLLQQWHIERGSTSSATAMLMAPACQRIIGMGQDALPLILTQLKSEGDDPDHWFWALWAITGANPVPAEVQGDTVKMAHAWLEWAAHTAGQSQ
jgi:hypothetical protein